MAYSKGIAVVYQPEVNVSKPWVVWDDGLCYDRYATEAEARSIAGTLVGVSDLALTIELDLNEFVEELTKRTGQTTEAIQKHIKGLLTF